MEAEAQRLAPGALVAERYRVVSFLDEGGMGAVYRVEHLHMRKTFALKVLHRALVDRPEMLTRFEREAVAAGSIEHPNVAAATDFGRLPDGSFFLIMEFVRGRNLRDELEGGALPPDRASRIVRGIVAGVGAAHAKGIVHRDLKPENIMLVEHDGDRDFVKVLDFGIAKFEDVGSAGPAGMSAPLTRAGSLIGTLEYMSPEQAMGNPVDARSDLYSIGVIFYELLSGRCPFEGEPVRLVQQHVMTEAPPLAASVVVHLDPRVPGIVQRLLSKRPEDRYATAAELAAALNEAGTQPRLVVRPSPRPPPAAPPDRHQRTGKAFADLPVAVRVGMLGVALALAAIGYASLRAGDRRESAAGPASIASDPRSAAGSPPAATAPSPAPSPIALPPAPTPSGSDSPPPERRAAPAPGSGSAPGHRRTGPGGIYIPPPRDWFK
jgi:serine/threonine protein kinase